MQAMDRFLNKIRINESSGCWEWQGGKNYKGYGYLRIGGRTYTAHRISYQLFVGNLASDMVVHHRCENKSCVNPDHLEMLTASAHASLRRERSETHCKRGHELTKANTYIHPDGVTISCVTCKYLSNKGDLERERFKKQFIDSLNSMSDSEVAALLEELSR